VTHRALRRRYGRAGLRVRPFIMWVEDAIRDSGIPSRVEYRTPEWRKRFRLWYDSGETVAGAAEMLRKWPWPHSGGAPPTGPALKALRERMEKMIRERSGK
jgi:hypothetical protein